MKLGFWLYFSYVAMLNYHFKANRLTEAISMDRLLDNVRLFSCHFSPKNKFSKVILWTMARTRTHHRKIMPSSQCALHYTVSGLTQQDLNTLLAGNSENISLLDAARSGGVWPPSVGEAPCQPMVLNITPMVLWFIKPARVLPRERPVQIWW